MMTREELAAAFAEAVERRNRERRQAYVTYTEAEELQAKLEGRTLERVSIYAPEFKDAETTAQFWDDRVIERNRSWWDRPETPVLAAVAVAVRDGGAEAARAAVKAAKQLAPAAQFAVFDQLRLWRKHQDAYRFGAERVIDQVLAEYERLKLPTEDPAEDRKAERRRRPWEVTETEATA